ncbi:MAG: HD domain-containing protein [Butyrivibrio sp.]|uniref:HD domain-containing phosphohydrolase n=1 Tax=Butyrivibrio sp. TaxID=28121 RepID=UPI0025C50DDE|nr:HD domain-containing phosphohydrolase [Butyrivibrio sp.]MBQ6587108.1 HD domain-containing protein [Butyrivibrio sp.]
MKMERPFHTFLMFIAVLMMLLTGYLVNKIAIENNVSSEVTADLNLYGAKLSDILYASVTKKSETKTTSGYDTEYEFLITNIGDNTISNWKATLSVPNGTIVKSSWDAALNQHLDRNELVFTPEYYSIDIHSYEATAFRLLLNTIEPFDPHSIKFVGYEVVKGQKNIIGPIIQIAIAIWAISFIGYWVTRFNIRNYKERQQNDVKIILQSMNTFISFIDAKDPYTRGHSKRVAMYGAEIAKRMGLSEDEVQNIYYAGLLHDSGKISIPDAVLNKPGKLTDEERKLIQNHTIAGGKMLKQLSSIRGIRETALYHHERYDGTGYPEGLRGESIPLYARIVGVADAYDAMSSNRVYRRHLNKDEIIEEIQKGGGKQFDPDIVKYMVDMINDGYVNVVKMETADSEEGANNFHLTESDIPGVYMGY